MPLARAYTRITDDKRTVTVAAHVPPGKVRADVRPAAQRLTFKAESPPPGAARLTPGVYHATLGWASHPDPTTLKLKRHVPDLTVEIARLTARNKRKGKATGPTARRRAAVGAVNRALADLLRTHLLPM